MSVCVHACMRACAPVFIDYRNQKTEGVNNSLGRDASLMQILSFCQQKAERDGGGGGDGEACTCVHR